MRQSYDPASDTAYFRFRGGAVFNSEEPAPGFVVDRDVAGDLLGVEFQRASAIWSPSNLAGWPRTGAPAS